MLATEAEAANRQCVGPANCGMVMSTREPREDRRCIGSSCMAWRWMCTVRKLIYENGDAFEQLPEDKWLGVCGIVEPTAKGFFESVDMLPKRQK
jgi:hypothetical protein